MRFIADGMLGKLSRWLRLAGHDVTYIGDAKLPPETQDDALLEWAKLEKRTLLTSDLALHRRAMKIEVKSILIKGSDVVSQLIEISKRIGQRIEVNPENSRCPVCNGFLEFINKERIKGVVPASVFRIQRKFWRCAKCGKLYWHGSHWKTIIEMASHYNELVK